MKRKFIPLFALLGILSIDAQVATVDTNNIKLGAISNGDIGVDYNDGSVSLAEMPIGSGKTTLYGSCLWMGGVDEDMSLHMAANTYGQSGVDFAAGPVADVYDSVYAQKYNRTWEITIQQVEYHIANYLDLNYEIPEVITNWPANGDTLNGESAQLAPFDDLNGNGVYEPLLGEHPLIRGDKSAFIMYNDKSSLHFETGGAAIGAEIHLMMYSYDSVNDDVDNSVFFHYEIFNRDTFDFEEFWVGEWLDWDLGGYTDDYIGCDLGRNLTYVYNGDPFDELPSGYGVNPPASGFVNLNENLDAHIGYANMSINPDDSTTGLPISAVQYYNYLTGKLKDGSNYEVNNTVTKYMYAGDSNSAFPDTNLTEGNANILPGDRRGINSTKFYGFESGSSICLDYAFVYARDITGDNLDNLEFLKERVDSIQVFYDNHFEDCSDFSVDIENLEIIEALEDSGFDAFYNADLNQWILHSDDILEGEVEVIISNVQGQLIDVQSWITDSDHVVSPEGKSSGSYFITLKKEGESFSFPIVFK